MGIEKEFLKPVIKSPRECKRILIDPKGPKCKIFMCSRGKRDLKGTTALEYINWGESEGFHKRPSCAGSAGWWEARLEAGNGILVKEANDTLAVYYNPERFPAGCRLYCSDLPHLTLELPY